MPLVTVQEREKLLKEISDLDALRAQKAKLLNPADECLLTPRVTVLAPTPKGGMPTKSPPSSARAPSTASRSGQSVPGESDDDDEKEPLLYLFVICMKHHMEYGSLGIGLTWLTQKCLSGRRRSPRMSPANFTGMEDSWLSQQLSNVFVAFAPSVRMVLRLVGTMFSKNGLLMIGVIWSRCSKLWCWIRPHDFCQHPLLQTNLPQPTLCHAWRRRRRHRLSWSAKCKSWSERRRRKLSRWNAVGTLRRPWRKPSKWPSLILRLFSSKCFLFPRLHDPWPHWKLNRF